jgi:hypothetical protein
MVDHFLNNGSQPSAGLVKKVKKVLFIFLLELLSEESHTRFFTPQLITASHMKALKTQKQCEANKKTQAAQKEKGMSAGLLVSTPQYTSISQMPLCLLPSR